MAGVSVAQADLAGSRADSKIDTAEWLTLETEFFDFHFPKNLQASGDRLAKDADAIHRRLSKKYMWAPTERTQVVLVDTQDDANGFTYLLPYNWIFLYVTAPHPDEPLGDHDDWLKTLLSHEYTHVLHIDQYGGAITPFRWLLGKLVAPNGLDPTWYREGLATYEETTSSTRGRGRSSYKDMVLRTMVLNNDFVTQVHANGYGWRWPGSSTPYFYGVDFVQYLAKTRGDQSLIDFNRALSRHLTWLFIDHHAKKVFGKDLNGLWEEWHQSLVAEVNQFKTEREQEGLTSWSDVVVGRDSTNAYTLSADGQKVVYLSESPERASEIRVRAGTQDRKILKGVDGVTRLSLSPDGNLLAFAQNKLYQRKLYLRQVSVYNFTTKKVEDIPKGVRGEDPTFSPDGNFLLFVTNMAGTKGLVKWDLREKKLTEFEPSVPAFFQVSHPSYSPDGRHVAVTAWHDTHWDLRLYDADGKALQWLTDDVAIDIHPSWKNNDTVIFSSDRDGTFNIYQKSLQTGKVTRLTNTLTGAFEPQLMPDGHLAAQNFRSGGFDIKTANDSHAVVIASQAKQSPALKSEVATSSPLKAETPRDGTSITLKPYSPFNSRLVIPRYIIPNVDYNGKGLLFMGDLGSQDPAQWHLWRAGANYRTDAAFLGGYFAYVYGRYTPKFGLGAQRYAFDLASIAFKEPAPSTNVRNVDYVEQRTRGFVNVSLPFNPHAFLLGYFYEDRRNHSALSVAELAGLKTSGYNIGGYAGFETSYLFNNAASYPASISLEEGRKIRLTGMWTDQRFGAAALNEQRIFSGDWREYIDLPWWRNVVAVRATGGIGFGDEGLKRIFVMGGALGELPGGGGSSIFYFPLRGLPLASTAGSRAVLVSAEYRFPIVSPQRTFVLEAVFVKDLHFALFTDYGETWTRATPKPLKTFFDDFLLSTGGELRGDFVLNPGIPFYGRLGYGVIVKNRDQIVGLKDSLLGTPLTSGTLILQLGTSF